MDELVEKIKSSIENRQNEPWFPELTADLAASGWDNLRRDIGLTPETYGTERVIARDTSAPRDIVISLNSVMSTCSTPSVISIEALGPKCAIQYQKQGINFFSPDEILNTTILSCLEDALAIINQLPSLMKTVAALVRSLHVIKSESVDYDISFSEPLVPFSIFISVPQVRLVNDGLRVAEAIIHESMHLQLSLIERHSRMVNSDAHLYFSPWRGEFRTAGGIMHGLYVFSVIDAFLGRLLPSMEAQTIRHLIQRCKQIRNQVDELHSFKQSEQLTKLGLVLVERLVDTRPVGMTPTSAKGYL